MIKRVIEGAVCVIGLTFIGRAVLYPSSAQIITTVGRGLSTMIKVIVAENAIIARSPQVWDRLLDLTNEDQLQLYVDLADDLDWVIDQLLLADQSEKK